MDMNFMSYVSIFCLVTVAMTLSCKKQAPDKSAVKIARAVGMSPQEVTDASFSVPLWVYRCDEPTYRPDPGTGTLFITKENPAVNHIITAHHVVEVLRNKFRSTVILPNEHSPQVKFSPPNGVAVCGKDPLPGYIRSSEIFLSQSVAIGQDVAIIKLPQALNRKAVELEDPRTIKVGESIFAYGFGYSDCHEDPNGVGKSGEMIMRKGEFRVTQNDPGLGAFYTEPLSAESAVTCAADSGVGYVVKRPTGFKIVAIHKGKPDRKMPVMYGTMHSTYFVCKVFQAAGLNNHFCVPR